MEFIKPESVPRIKVLTVFITLFSRLIFNIYTIKEFKTVVLDNKFKQSEEYYLPFSSLMTLYNSYICRPIGWVCVLFINFTGNLILCRI